MATVVTAWSSPTPSTRASLVNKVCGLYGIEPGNDSEMAQRALEWLDEAVDDLNMGLYEFNKTIEVGIILTNGVSFVTLNADFYRESLAHLVRTSDSQKYGPLTCMEWVDFKRMYGDDKPTGLPFVYSVFNFDNDSRKLYLCPTPSTDAANGYTLSVEYYRRVPKISSVGEGSSIQVPTEVEAPIRFGAFKRAAMWFDDPTKVQMYAGLEAQATERLKRVDRFHPDALKRFRLVDAQPRSGTKKWGGIYLKID
jgi:hypothetical protein